ncbi:type VII secretion protein EccB [Streptomyces litchfieldiae]|uniref:Type VII secretion protein EccB n=1 Tax=Streptomyces litchfieldiae TaxID=3075543 RepID=A0ABU2MS41_9ACTN|nr:type VII secretion protein EccB [Streptomyces sp. DSM 44938]MDT0344217.1 type VII secretion protein EccB [Streptomyces sp. DSM 44938]
MATTREQAEAYAYENRRRTTGLIRGTDEAAADPRRRLNRALGGGVAIGVLIMAGFGIAGWLGGGRGPELPDNGAVVAGGSGDRYVVTDGVVHPALNLASALLVGGGEITKVRQATLDDAPRGLPVGIPGAPDALPDADDLAAGDWTLCATPSETGGAPTATALYVSVPIGPADPATVLAQDENGDRWLLTEGRRHALEPAAGELLGLQRVTPVELPRQVLATVPEGPALTIPAPAPDAGDAPAVDLPFDAAVGDLAHTDTSGPNPQYYLVRSDGLTSVSALTHALLTAAAAADHEIGATDAARAPRSAEPPPGDPAWPDALPVADEPGRDQPVCVTTPPGGRPGDAPWQATITLPGAMPDPAGLTPVRGADGERLGLLDAIHLPPGTGALVRATTSAGTGGTHTLITDSGTAYPIASPDAVRRLGYRPDDAPAMPVSFVGLLPAGPVLDPEAAAAEQRGVSR